jgi:hypothetical protein
MRASEWVTGAVEQEWRGMQYFIRFPWMEGREKRECCEVSYPLGFDVFIALTGTYHSAWDDGLDGT